MRPRTHPVTAGEHDFCRAREVGLVLRSHRFAEAPVLDRHVEPVVPHPARDVEIGRPDARAQSVRNRGLRMQHRPVPLEDSHASGREQRPERSGTARAEPLVDDAHVDARPRPRGQRIDELAAEGVVVDDVVLGENRALGGVNGSEPRRIVVGGVLEHAHGVHPLATSVTSSVWQKWPWARPPSWPTRSISTNPGCV